MKLNRNVRQSNQTEFYNDLSSLFDNFLAAYNPNLTPKEWAELFRILPATVTKSEYADKLMNYDVTPYWIELLENMTNPDVTRMAVMKGTQVGYSQGVLETIIGWVIYCNPAAMAYVSASKDLAKEVFGLRIVPMIEQSGLLEKINIVKENLNNGTGLKTKNITAEKVIFDKGFLLTLSGKSAVHLSTHALRFMLIDELDKMPENVKKHGDMVSIANSRTSSYKNERKIIYGSSPLYWETSKIRTQFELGDQRRWHVPCPHCNTKQVLHWNGDQYFGNTKPIIDDGKPNPGLKYELDDQGNLIPDSIYYLCKHGCIIKEHEKWDMNLKGEWIPSRIVKNGYRSYHISAIPSNVSSWQDIIQIFLDSKDDINALQVWVNNYLGEPWRMTRSFFDDQIIKYKNVRNYRSGIVPNQLAINDGNSKIINLICSVDVNGNINNVNGWLAVDIKGYCENGQSYTIAKCELKGNLGSGGDGWLALGHIIKSKFKSDTVTKTLILSKIVGDKKITRKYRQTFFTRDDAIKAPAPDIVKSENWIVENMGIKDDTYDIALCAIDAGFRSETVYGFVNEYANAVAVRGRAMATSEKDFLLSRLKKCPKYYNLNVNKKKNTLFEDLAADIDKVKNKQPSRFMNFPDDTDNTGLEFLELSKKYDVLLSGGGFDDHYFSTYASEYKNDRGIWGKKDSRAYNHFLDTTIYNQLGWEIYIDVIRSRINKNEPSRTLFDIQNESIIAKYLNKNGRVNIILPDLMV